MSTEQEPAAGETAESQATAKPGKRKIILAAAGAAVLLLGGGGAYALSGGDAAEAETEESAAADHGESEGGHGEGDKFIDVPPMVVNLRSADGAARFIKLHFMLVPGANGTEEGLKEKLPVLLDAYQPFLRELRPEDLAGSAAVFRIKEEMLVRARETLGEGQVKDVLIQDLIQQ